MDGNPCEEENAFGVSLIHYMLYMYSQIPDIGFKQSFVYPASKKLCNFEPENS